MTRGTFYHVMFQNLGHFTLGLTQVGFGAVGPYLAASLPLLSVNALLWYLVYIFPCWLCMPNSGIFTPAGCECLTLVYSPPAGCACLTLMYSPLLAVLAYLWYSPSARCAMCMPNSAT